MKMEYSVWNFPHSCLVSRIKNPKKLKVSLKFTKQHILKQNEYKIGNLNNFVRLSGFIVQIFQTHFKIQPFFIFHFFF